MTCNHQCSSNCRRRGCNCICGEWHCDPEGECIYTDKNEAPCPNHPKPTMYERVIDSEISTGGFSRDILDTKKLATVLAELENRIEASENPKDLKEPPTDEREEARQSLLTELIDEMQEFKYGGECYNDCINLLKSKQK